LEGARGRTYRQGDLAVKVLDVRPGPESPPSIDLVAQLDGDRPFPSLRSPVNSWTYWAGGRIEVRDARGDRLAWRAGPPPPGGSEIRPTLRIRSEDRASHPAEIRYQGLMRTIAEVPIELNDIPILER
jgi:hypothetical protein